MSDPEPLYRLIKPEGTHAADSKNTEGTIRGALLDDETNQLIGQGEFIPVDPEDDEGSHESEPAPVVLGVAVGIAVGVTATIVIAKALPPLQRWFVRTAVPSIQTTVNRVVTRAKRTSVTVAELIGIRKNQVEAKEAAKELAVVVSEPRIEMSSQEAQRRYLAAMMAVAFIAEQVRVLSSAEIKDKDQLAELEEKARALSSPAAIAGTNRMLEANPELLDQESQDAFVELFGGGVAIAGAYAPLSEERVKEALRLRDF